MVSSCREVLSASRHEDASVMQQDPAAPTPPSPTRAPTAPSPARASPPPEGELNVSDIPMSEIEVDVGTHSTEASFPDPAILEPDQTVSAAATDSAAAQEKPSVAADSATVHEDLQAPAADPAPAPEVTVSETRVPDSSITPPAKPSASRASPAKSPGSAQTQTTSRSVSVSTSFASAIGLHSLRFDAMKLKSSIGRISLAKILQQQKKKQVQGSASGSPAASAGKKPVSDTSKLSTQIELHASAAAKIAGKVQLGLSVVKGRHGFCPLRTPGGQSFGDLQQMAEAWNAADLAEMPLKQAKVDPTAGIIEKTGIEAHVAAENAILARRVTLLLS